MIVGTGWSKVSQISEGSPNNTKIIGQDPKEETVRTNHMHPKREDKITGYKYPRSKGPSGKRKLA